MGWIRKKTKQIGRAIKKIGKKIGKAFKKIIKPFAKVFGKLGPLGSMAMMFILPGIGQMIAGWGAAWAGPGASFLGKIAGHAVKFVGNAINFVATAPQKIFQTITSGITSGWNGLFKAGQAGTLGTVDALGAGPADSWWGSFKNDMQNVWGNRGVVDSATGLIDQTASSTGGNFFDVSKIGEAANKTLKDQWSGPQGFKEDIKNLFKSDSRTALTEANAPAKFKTLFTDTTGTFDKIGYDDALKTFTDKSVIDLSSIKGGEVFKLDRTGFFGNVKDFVGGTGSKIGDVTIPALGDLRDIGSVASMGVGAYSTLAQFGVVGSDDEVGGAGDFGVLAEEQLYGGDQGGLYNTSAPAWDYDYAASAFQNSTNAQDTWNTNYGLPQGLNPMNSPGYGWSYEQWLQQQMAA